MFEAIEKVDVASCPSVSCNSFHEIGYQVLLWHFCYNAHHITGVIKSSWLYHNTIHFFMWELYFIFNFVVLWAPAILRRCCNTRNGCCSSNWEMLNKPFQKTYSNIS